jgi:hypothetical protein
VEAALIPASKTPSAPPGADAAQPTRARNVSFSRPPYASSDGLILQTVLYNLLENFTDLSAEPGVAPPALLQTYAQEVLSLEQLRAAEANARARDPVQLAVSAAAPAVLSRDGPALQRWEHGSSGRGAQYVGRMGAVSSRQLASYHVDLEEVDDQDKLFYMHLVKSLNVHPLAILNGGLSAYGRRWLPVVGLKYLITVYMCEFLLRRVQTKQMDIYFDIHILELFIILHDYYYTVLSLNSVQWDENVSQQQSLQAHTLDSSDNFCYDSSEQ